MEKSDLDTVPNVGLLRCDGVRNASIPRDNHTKVSHAGVEYCMTIEGVSIVDKRPRAQVSTRMIWCFAVLGLLPKKTCLEVCCYCGDKLHLRF